MAATTAALGVPSPSLSKDTSFDGSPHSVSNQALRKCDLEEEEQLLRALKMSEASMNDPVEDHANDNKGEVSLGSDGNMCNKQAVIMDSEDNIGKNTGKESNDYHESVTSIPDVYTASSKDYNEHISSTSTLGGTTNLSSKNDAVSDFNQLTSMGPKESNLNITIYIATQHFYSRSSDPI